MLSYMLQIAAKILDPVADIFELRPLNPGLHFREPGSCVRFLTHSGPAFSQGAVQQPHGGDCWSESLAEFWGGE
jgi:hypothetical protein